jgi:hypothetical protein
MTEAITVVDWPESSVLGEFSKRRPRVGFTENKTVGDNAVAATGEVSVTAAQ